jgi:hypothetical protein
MPTHEQIAEAVAETGSPELAAWTRTPESYVLRRSTLVNLENHSIWFVIPADAPHPVSVTVCASEDEAIVTTQRPIGVARVIAGEPALHGSPELAAAVVELIRDHRRAWKLAGPAAVRENDGATELELPVADDRGTREVWHVTLRGGASTFRRDGGAE